MNVSNKKSMKTISKSNKNNSEITYEIVPNDSKDVTDIVTEQPVNKKQLGKPTYYIRDFPVKPILGDVKKIRSTCARLIKAGLRGEVSQAEVNTVIWQLRSLVYFDQCVADLTDHNTLVEIARVMKKDGKL